MWVGFAFAVIMLATIPVVPSLFSNDDAVISRVGAGMVFLALVQIPGSIAFALDGVLIGAHDTRFLSRAAMFHLVPLAPLLILTAMNPALGIVGIWIAELLYMTSRASLNQWRFASRRWLSSHSRATVTQPA
ncbi:MAG TPA: hypothetical protein VK549_00660, partial [Acidimicrobiia bacterium]|nr:hypothetical protein [Acidimicrobiia bacterium]